MPVILKTQDEIDAWMTAPPKEALSLRRPLPDSALRIVARGKKSDGFEAGTTLPSADAHGQRTRLVLLPVQTQGDECRGRPLSVAH